MSLGQLNFKGQDKVQLAIKLNDKADSYEQ